MDNPTAEKLFNTNFLKVAIASLFMFTGFYLVMPIIAQYSQSELGVDASMAGVIAASYIITALLVRPFSGYLVDRFDRKKFYMTVFIIFALMFSGYIISTTVGELILTRVLLGASFSLVTTAASTLAIDVVPSQYRADGIGYYAAIIVLAMAIGPMLGLYLVEIMSYNELVIFATISCWIGVLIGATVKTKPRELIVHEEALSVDRFFMKEGISIAIVIAIMYFLYGSLTVFVSLYIKEISVDINSGNFFLFFAVGIMSARAFTGKMLHNREYNKIVLTGSLLIIAAGALFSTYLCSKTFVAISVALGLGFGMIAPAIQSMMIDLVPAKRRGTANSTFYIALDLGSGAGMLAGGAIAQMTSYTMLYKFGTVLAIFAIIFYIIFAKRSYEKQLAKQNV